MKNQDLINSRNIYENLLSNINVGIVIRFYDFEEKDDEISYVSDGFTKLTGYTFEELKSAFNCDYKKLIFESDLIKTNRKIAELASANSSYQLEYKIQRKDGTVIWVVDSSCITIEKNILTCQSVLIDISSTKRQQEELRISEERFRIAAMLSNDVIFEVDLQKQRYTYFENSEKIFRISGEKILQDTEKFSKLSSDEYMKAASEYFCHPNDNETVAQAFIKINKGLLAEYEARMRAGSSKYIWCKINLTPILDEDGVPIRMIGNITNIDEMKRQANLLKAQIKKDLFTGLYNKIYTINIIEEMIENSSENNHAFIMLDIDNFKQINDTMGHSEGDNVIVDLSKKLTKIFNENEIVGRVGGDEFLVFVPNIEQVEDVLLKAKKLVSDFYDFYKIAESNFKFSISVGISLYPQHGESYNILFKNADSALYESKRKGKNCVTLYSDELL